MMSDVPSGIYERMTADWDKTAAIYTQLQSHS